MSILTKIIPTLTVLGLVACGDMTNKYRLLQGNQKVEILDIKKNIDEKSFALISLTVDGPRPNWEMIDNDQIPRSEIYFRIPDDMNFKVGDKTRIRYLCTQDIQEGHSRSTGLVTCAYGIGFWRKPTYLERFKEPKATINFPEETEQKPCVFVGGAIIDC